MEVDATFHRFRDDCAEMANRLGDSLVSPLGPWPNAWAVDLILTPTDMDARPELCQPREEAPPLSLVPSDLQSTDRSLPGRKALLKTSSLDILQCRAMPPHHGR